MPAKKGKSKIAGMLGAAGNEAFLNNRDNEVELGGGGRLPAGIDNGVAQVTNCKVDYYSSGDNEGQPYFSMQAAVILPEDHEGVPVKGMYTYVREPLFETPNRTRKSIDDHVKKVVNEIKKLGIDTSDLNADNFEAFCQAITEQGPHTKFSTYNYVPDDAQPGDQPILIERWDGACPAPKAAGPGAGVTAGGKSVAKGKASKTAPPEPEEDESAEDLTALAEAADAGGDPEQERLTEIAHEAGISDETLESVETWAEVVTLIEGGESEEEGDEGGDQPEFAPPEKGDVFNYKPPRKRNPIEVEVTTVNNGQETCSVKEVESGKLHKAVPWDKLTDLE